MWISEFTFEIFAKIGRFLVQLDKNIHFRLLINKIKRLR